MTKDEFDVRWKTLSYNRQESQGRFADNPNRISGEKRVVFGRSGKGRHGAFCFANSYEIETRKDGRCFVCRVERATVAGPSPFRFTVVEESASDTHGTTIRAAVIRNFVSKKA